MRPIIKYRGKPARRNSFFDKNNDEITSDFTENLKKKLDKIDGTAEEEIQEPQQEDKKQTNNKARWRRRKNSKHKFKIKEIRPLRKSRKLTKKR